MMSKQTKVDFKKYNNAATENYEVPPAGIQNIDKAVFNLFDKQISFDVKIDGELKKVPVVFASGERFALTRRNSPIRDKNNTLILPIISIVRGDIDFSPGQLNRGTAITPRDQESYIVKKRLANSDRSVQNILNKQLLKNQDNVSKYITGKSTLDGNQIGTRRNQSFSKSGGMINLGNDNLGKNIYEVIQIPYPSFIAISYKITFWCQYMTQMNSMQEIYLSQFRGQGEEFLIKTEEGYEYVAASSTTFSFDTNFTNYTEEERIIKSSFDISVPGYILNARHPGLPNQIRSTYSAPFIEFGYFATNSQIITNNTPDNKNNNVDKFVLSDVMSEDETNNNLERGQSSEEVRNVIVNPFTGQEEVKYSKVLTRNDRSGETVASNLVIKKIETQFN